MINQRSFPLPPGHASGSSSENLPAWLPKTTFSARDTNDRATPAQPCAAVGAPAAVPEPQQRSPRSIRIGVSVFFVLHGLWFASWASRIPTIQRQLHLSESALGTILFALPVGFFISLPFSGWFIARSSSRSVVLVSSAGYSLALVSVGLASTSLQVFAALLVLGFFANMLNISMNTQATAVERLYGKRLLATFHGLWSLAGFASAAIGTWMVAREMSPFFHFTCMALLFIPGVIFASRYLIREDKSENTSQAGGRSPMLALPDKALLGLGVIAFCSMMVEGGMFDWSAVYMSRVVNTNAEQAALGYTLFMIAMATTRFTADLLSARFGLKRTLQASGLLATTGLLVVALVPSMIPAMVGLVLVGMGVSSVVPMVYSAAGRSRTMAAGTAITAVSSLGFLGFLIGPPAIGYIAAVATLRGSFIGLALMAAAVFTLATFRRFDEAG